MQKHHQANDTTLDGLSIAYYDSLNKNNYNKNKHISITGSNRSSHYEHYNHTKLLLHCSIIETFTLCKTKISALPDLTAFITGLTNQ